MRRQIAALHVYPVKSCAPMSMVKARVESRGLEHDRRWMAVGADGYFITGRQVPKLTRLLVSPQASGIRLEAEGLDPLAVAVPADDAPRLAVTVWRSRVDARLAPAEANDWISRFLGRDCQLVHMDSSAVRPVDPQYAQVGDEVSFADAFPLLLTSMASLDSLNSRLKAPVGMLRFRPNLVVEGGAAHDEDDWKRLRIGSLEFDVAKPCSRCIFTTVDPATGEPDPHGEPLRTLTQYRQTRGGVMFGMNLIARSEGVLRVGDEIEVLG